MLFNRKTLDKTHLSYLQENRSRNEDQRNSMTTQHFNREISELKNQIMEQQVNNEFRISQLMNQYNQEFSNNINDKKMQIIQLQNQIDQIQQLIQQEIDTQNYIIQFSQQDSTIQQQELEQATKNKQNKQFSFGDNFQKESTLVENQDNQEVQQLEKKIQLKKQAYQNKIISLKKVMMKEQSQIMAKIALDDEVIYKLKKELQEVREDQNKLQLFSEQLIQPNQLETKVNSQENSDNSYLQELDYSDEAYSQGLYSQKNQQTDFNSKTKSCRNMQTICLKKLLTYNFCFNSIYFTLSFLVSQVYIYQLYFRKQQLIKIREYQEFHYQLKESCHQFKIYNNRLRKTKMPQVREAFKLTSLHFHKQVTSYSSNLIILTNTFYLQNKIKIQVNLNQKREQAFEGEY